MELYEGLKSFSYHEIDNPRNEKHIKIKKN